MLKEISFKALDYVSKYLKVFHEIVMNVANYFIFRYSSSKKKIRCLYFKITSKEKVNGMNSKRNGGKTGREF